MFKNLSILLLSVCVVSVAATIKNYQYVYPSPGAKRVAVESAIIVRLDGVGYDALKPNELTIRVFGAKNGSVSGSTVLASDGQTLLFQPDAPLAYDDAFEVQLIPAAFSQLLPYSFQFETIAQAHIFLPETNTEESTIPSGSHSLRKTMNSPRVMPNGVSVPGDFPHINVAINKQTADGYIFINNWRDDGPYNVIFANDGSPVWYQRQVDGDRRRDFKVQKNNTISMLTRAGGTRFFGYDQNFNFIDEYSAQAGYSTDEHELQVLENGHYLLIGVRGVTVDMSAIGGSSRAGVSETTIQEFTPDHEMIFNWPALEHLDPADMIGWCDPGQADPKANSFRFPHMNAIDIDDDGHILLSSRHLSEVTKINRQTGDIIWRLGGANSDFTFVNDDLNGFRMQHDIRVLGNNRYTVFDNGNLHNPSQSRAVEYVLDLDKKTATLAWEFRGPEGRNFYSHYMGNNQRMPNGNVFINWVTGGNPKAMEVTPEGEVVYEMNFVDRYDTYRTFRFPWNGIVSKPSLYIEQENNSLVLIFNKFGDDNVDYYKIYGDIQPGPTAVVDTSRATLKKLTGLINEQRYYFRVTAVGKDGVESDFSNEVDVFVNLVNPGSNIVRNGNFSSNTEEWDVIVNGADATHQVTGDGEMLISVQNPGSSFSSIQLAQAGLSLVRGKTYLFEFDAYSTANRTIEALVQKNSAPWTNYGKLNPTALRRAKQHFAYEFIMEDASDFNARVAFNCGLFPGDVYIDNVALTNIQGELPFSTLNEPWKNQDIGGPNMPGTAGVWQDRYVVSGAGNDIWGTEDQFHFAYVPFVGDGVISARVVSMTATNGWAKAGMMIRNTLQAGSKHAFSCATVSNGIAFQRRVDTDAASLNINTENDRTPYWVKLERRGNAFFSYKSADGKTWTRLGSERIEMNETVYAGFAVTSHDGGQVCEATFDDLNITSETAITNPATTLPQHFALWPAYPNPFNPRTTIRYTLSTLAKVSLNVYNVRGELVDKLIDKKQSAGDYSVDFDASDLPSGVYLYELETVPTTGATFHAVQKMTVIK